MNDTRERYEQQNGKQNIYSANKSRNEIRMSVSAANFIKASVCWYAY